MDVSTFGIYIAYGTSNQIESIVLATTREQAVAFWQGAGITACKIKEINANTRMIIENPQFVYELIRLEFKEKRYNERSANISVREMPHG